MNCSRCQGFMVREHFLDFDGTIGHMWARGYRCMNCGNVHDPIIERHRRTRNHRALALPNGEPESQQDELSPECHTPIMRAA